MQIGLAVLEVVITIAPLLGLLGTVSGLVGVFGTFGDAGAEIPDPGLLAAGIAEALNTTIGGSRSRSSSRAGIGTQRIPPVCRTMNAIFSGVA